MFILGGEHIMIRKFSVENFKGFKEEIMLDLSNARDYSFNTNLVDKGVVKKGIIYGKNGSGKSNLGFALYDLTVHLTDKQKPDPQWYINYSNLDNNNKIVSFKYEFQFDNHIYTYTYAKTDVSQLIFERLVEGEKVIINFDYFNKANNVINIEEASNLRVDIKDNQLSILKYIYKNTLLEETSPVSKIVKFAEAMLWFRCLNSGNNYIGLLSGPGSMDEIIIKSNTIKEFEEFLAKNGLKYKLVARVFNNQNILFAKFKSGEAVFSSIISTGTQALWLYFCWSLFFKDVSFAFIDEFDAFYHYETAEIILRAINDSPNMQAIVTSHNTYLMKNSITRPDCCFILTAGHVNSLSECTEKEIREAHNLEKMYRNGAFTE